MWLILGDNFAIDLNDVVQFASERTFANTTDDFRMFFLRRDGSVAKCEGKSQDLQVVLDTLRAQNSRPLSTGGATTAQGLSEVGGMTAREVYVPTASELSRRQSEESFQRLLYRLNLSKVRTEIEIYPVQLGWGDIWWDVWTDVEAKATLRAWLQQPIAPEVSKDS